MAYNFPSGFNITSTEAVDKRLVMTKAEMVAVKVARMPSVYFTVCSDDGKMYIYNSSNEANSETGRFRVLETSVTTENIGQIISSDSDNMIQVTSNGLKVTEPESISDATINNLFTTE